MRLIRIKEVLTKTGLSRSALFKLVFDGEFPKPVKIGENSPRGATAWVESEIDDWIANLVARRDAS